ncbi:MAG: hypothetical protein K2K88_09925 [Muribaculaceae bacterium]|nr:hypothetical protein [Muribaculaceae bacterium]MDE6644401.1 hypothetical protein [Muribaculaceae bacterium]
MKKKFFLLATLVLASLTASASVEIIAWCGKTMITVDREYFEEDEDCGDCPESAEYYQSLVEMMCGPGHNDGYTIRRN